MNRLSIVSVMTRKIYLLSALLFIALLFSCKKDGELSPDFDLSAVSIQFTDTLSIEAIVVKEDSFRTDLSEFYLLGLYHDPLFGVKSSSIYTNVKLAGSTNFGSGFSIDSIVLTLAYAGLYGNPNSSMSINVYELSSPLDESKNYYSNDTAAYNSTLLKSLTFTPNLTDSVLTAIDGVMHAPHLRIKIDDPTFISNFESDTLYSDNAALNNVLGGLYITTANNVTNSSLIAEEGSIAYFDMHSSLSTVTIYYKNATTDSLQESFLIDADTKKFSRFAHNYTGTDIEKHLTNSVSKDTTVSYLSSMAGVRTKLKVPYLKTLLKDGNIIINKAELTIPVAINTSGNYDTPLAAIGLAAINANGEAIFTPDATSYDYCGCLNTSTNTYTFDVSRYVHQLLYETSTDYGMYLIARGGAVNANRLVFGSSYNAFSPLKLNITYSKYN
ncbi:MAG: DUF4270 family protein [Vicingus serpentipes]|nr:DUF4270 family protein [Vicingus serpentipes]